MQVNPHMWLARFLSLSLVPVFVFHGKVSAAEIEWGNPAAARPPTVLQNMGDPTIIKEEAGSICTGAVREFRESEARIW